MAGRQKTDGKREEILGAAVEEFARRDYHEVLVDDVAARARVGKGTVYRYFPTKEELFVAAVLRGLGEFHEGFQRTLGAEAPLAEILSDVVSRMLGFFRGRAEFFALLLRYEHRLPPADAERWRERRAAAIAAVASALDREVRAGTLRPCDTTLCAELFLGMARTAIGSSLADARDPEVVARQIVAVFLEGLCATRTDASAGALRLARGGRA